jgi:ppGpp synthetase/RelA/SpoT-type nucleotidyltranferase
MSKQGITVEGVERFLQRKGPAYLKLLEAVRTAAEGASQKLGVGIVRSIYGRADKQDKTDLAEKSFKAPSKIAKAAARLGHSRLEEIDDIIGLTVVVHYPDQIRLVELSLVPLLANRRIGIHDNKEKKERGYYATHLVFQSDHTDHQDLRCELQIKTMLHDAWAAKTHDLTYKPQTSHDSRFDRMMSLFAESLQGIEILSETLRDMIQERWAAESRWRKILRRTMFESVPAWVDEDFSPEALAIRGRLIAAAERLERERDDDSVIQPLASDINILGRTQPREAYLLEGYLAMLTDRSADRQRAERRALEWLTIAPKEFSAGRARERDLYSVPLILHACGNPEKAIEASEMLLEAGGDFSPKLCHVVSFNLADFLVEQACFQLPSDPGEQAEMRERIESLLAAAAPLRQQEPTAFLDLEGMIDVAFASDAKTLEGAIRKIEQGNRQVPDREVETAQAYHDVHIRLAWRRLLEAEAKEAFLGRR